MQQLLKLTHPLQHHPTFGCVWTESQMFLMTGKHYHAVFWWEIRISQCLLNFWSGIWILRISKLKLLSLAHRLYQTFA
jgi:hypothetical protein